MTGCHAVAMAPPVNPIAHPVQQTQITEVALSKALLPINISAMMAAAVGLGLGIYGALFANSVLSRIGFLLAAGAGGVAAVSLIGLFVLPFVAWIAGGALILGLGFGGYEAYLYFSKKKNLPSTISVVK
jgi:hypothetical protein